MKHRDYSVEELLHSPSFRRLTEGTASPAEIHFWDQWIEQSHRNREKANKAKSALAGFEFADPEFPDIDKEWSALKDSAISSGATGLKTCSTKDSAIRWVYRAAASLLLASLVGIGSYWYLKQETVPPAPEQLVREMTVETRQGEKKSISFSNGAKIILNNNSSLNYARSSGKGETIQVQLEGEAYFHTEGPAPGNEPAFSVITPAGVIEDIGTEFLVRVEGDRTRVVLQEGRVKIEVAEDRSASGEFSVTKGEMVEFSKLGIEERGTVNPTFYTSWATGSMTFDQTKIRDFANYLEDRFEIKVEIADPDLAKVTIDGAVYFKSLEGLVRSVSDVIKVPVYQSEDRKTVYIGNLRGNHK